jgi:hypothetical protein
MNLNFILLLIVLWLLYYDMVYYEVYCEYFKSEDPVLTRLAMKLQTLDPKLRDITVHEGSKSYTVNKKRVFICIKDENGHYYDENMLSYVLCHEFAHVLCEEYNPKNPHTPKFHKIFQELLARAQWRGYYDPTKPLVQNYCGHD